MDNNNQTVFIVDDDEDVRDSLIELLASMGMQALAYENAQDFLDAFHVDQGGCVLVDVRMPGMSGIELQHKLNMLGATQPIIIITGHGDVSMAVQAMKNGAFDFLQKPFRDQELLDCITKALEQDKFSRKNIKDQYVIQQRIGTLTVREREVINKVLEGKANKVIARELGISDRTVEIHRSHAMEKLETKSVAGLVKIMMSAQV